METTPASMNVPPYDTLAREHRLIAGEEREALAREVEEMERREVGEGVFERYAALVERLESRGGGRAPASPSGDSQG